MKKSKGKLHRKIAYILKKYEECVKYTSSLYKGRIKELEEQVIERDAEIAACIKFLEMELHWERFREEGFLGEEVASISTNNCQKLAAFLKEKGNHGARLLSSHKEQLAQMNADIERLKTGSAAKERT